MVMRRSIVFAVLSLLLLCGGLCLSANAQGFDSDRMELASFLRRMYNNEPFEGVRVVSDYDNAYLLSVITLDKAKYPSESALNRVASVKAMSEASRYFNGSSISSDMIIHTRESKEGESDVWIVENIREHSYGYVKQLEQLTTFPSASGRQVFIYYKRLEQ